MAALDQSIFLVRKVVGELLTGGENVNVLLSRVAKLLLAEAAFRRTGAGFESLDGETDLFN